MSTELIGILSLVAIVGLVLLRVPVAIAMGLVGTIGYGLVDHWSAALDRLGNTPFELSEGYTLSVVPLFMLMGSVASRSGMSQDLFRATNGIFAGWRGTAAMATVGACAGFGSICGSSLATAATMSRIAIPEMRSLGYDVTEHVGGTGIVAVLKNGPGPTIMLRTELDALPVEEKTGLPYASTVRAEDPSGAEVPVMHACGHDLHMAALVGTAAVMAGSKDTWDPGAHRPARRGDDFGCTEDAR